jgi:SAM-dependent methyltransferase
LIADPRSRFSATAEDYHRYRPSYPAALVDFVLALPDLPSPPAVADVACGTGITTRLLAARGCEVVGVDPNPDMLAFARREGGARYVQGVAEATGLPDQSFDLVTAGQAFHWFDVAAVLRELGRILRGGGWCAAFWNLRQGGAFLDAYDRLLRQSSTEYERITTPEQAIEAIRRSPGVTSVREAEFANAQRFDRRGLFGRAHSSSYVAHGIADRAEFDRALDALFDAHQVDGAVEFVYRSVVIAWQLSASDRP